VIIHRIHGIRDRRVTVTTRQLLSTPDVERIDIPGGDGVALLAADRILVFGTKKLRLNWDLPLSQVLRVINEDQGIRFSHKAGKERDKFVVVEDQKSQAWFYEQIAGVVKSFNARKRIDS